MAEKKDKVILSADDGSELSKAEQERKIKEAKPVGSAGGKRLAAVILWLCAIAFEVLAILVLAGKINILSISQWVQLIGFLVLDLICLIIGSLLWKKANHIDPASEKNKVKFFLWNNMGVLVAVFAFVPFIILVLCNKKNDKKVKTVGLIVAIAALVIGALCSIDYNPVSAEQKAAAEQTITGNVYWSPFGHVYHTDSTCQALNQSDTLTMGTVEQAIAANRTRLCKFCAKRDGIEGVVTDDTEELTE